MEYFKLISEMYNPIVECELDCPIPSGVNLQVNDGYTTVEGKHRLINDGEIDLYIKNYFNNIFYYRIVPLLFSHPCFYHTYPIIPKTIKNSTHLNVCVFKDEVGWNQGSHEDPKVFFCSGVIHLQDCEQGTYFKSGSGLEYRAPTKKFQGAFWSNSHDSRHSVEEVTKERYGYLITVSWTFLQPHNFAGQEFVKKDFEFPIDYDEFYG